MELRLEGGGAAKILMTDGESVVLLARSSSPPGSTLKGELEGAQFSVKVRRCRREPDPGSPEATYRIEGRFLNLGRHQRERLLAGS